MPGLFIAFEGPEGAGKSTQIRLLSATLEADGYYVVSTREPGGTALGERIRSLLLDHDSGVMGPESEAYLHTAARAQHVSEVIRPALIEGAIVLCDRFVDSTLAYQGGGRGLPVSELISMQQLAISGIMPDVRLLLDVPVELGLNRRHAEFCTTNRMDTEDIAFHQRVRSTYLALAEQSPNGWQVIDATKPSDQVAAQILSIVSPLIASLRHESSVARQETPR